MTDQTIPVDKLRALLDGEGSVADKIQAIYDDLLPDPPLPDPLFLTKATHPKYGEGIVMSHRPDEDGDVRFVVPDEAIGDGTRYRWVDTSTLTFHTPDHPEFLETEGDYENAPEGTIVASNDEIPAVLVGELWRHIGLVGGSDHDDMDGLRRRVLRWGWEA